MNGDGNDTEEINKKFYGTQGIFKIFVALMGEVIIFVVLKAPLQFGMTRSILKYPVTILTEL